MDDGLGCFECIESAVPLFGRQAEFHLTSPRAQISASQLEAQHTTLRDFQQACRANGMLNLNTSTASALA